MCLRSHECVWIDDLPGGGKRSFIEINAPLNYKEMRDLHRILREHTGLYRKKSLSAADVEVLDFVASTPDMKWAEREAMWNAEHPEREFKSNGLLMAHKRAME